MQVNKVDDFFLAVCFRFGDHFQNQIQTTRAKSSRHGSVTVDSAATGRGQGGEGAAKLGTVDATGRRVELTLRRQALPQRLREALEHPAPELKVRPVVHRPRRRVGERPGGPGGLA